MSAGVVPRSRLVWLAAVLVALRIALPLVLVDASWGFHRDELLYFAMGDHLQAFGMQFPPFIAAVAHLSRAVFGDAVMAARVPAALGGGALLAVMLWLAYRLGAGAWALVTIALASVAAPAFVRGSVLMQPVIFDQLWATLAVAALVWGAHERAPRWWLLVGVALGLGALTKFSVAFYVAGIGITTLLVPELRGHLRTRWPWLGAGLAGALSIPSIAGQIAHGWPFLAQMRSLSASQLERVAYGEFLGEQRLLLGAATILVIAGVMAAVRGDVAARVAATFAGALLALMLALHGKSYYAAPGYPALMATGAVWLENWLARSPRPGVSLGVRVAVPVVIVVVAVLLFPIGVPILGPGAMARYAAAIGITAAVRTNQGEEMALPQDYADMLGWREQAEAVARVYHALPASEQGEAVIFASNYGEAGALAMYRERFALPYPVSVAGDFHAWGTGGRSGEVMILVGEEEMRDDLLPLFGEVTEVARMQDARRVPEERDVRIFVARRPKTPLSKLWPTIGPRWG